MMLEITKSRKDPENINTVYSTSSLVYFEIARWLSAQSVLLTTSQPSSHAIIIISKQAVGVGAQFLL